MDISALPINELLTPDGFDCQCGKHHKTSLKFIEIEKGAINHLSSILKRCNVKKPFIISDMNTIVAAGNTVLDILSTANVDFVSYTFPQTEIEPEEYPVGQVIMSFDPSCDFIIAVGSGVINDIAKIVAKACKVDYLLVATAPSMDGFASNSSSMTWNGVKSTIYAVSPVAIIADMDIMCNAPMLMIQAGLGDMVAKYVSICEWRISNIITNEYYCPLVAKLMRTALHKCIDQASSLKERNPQAILSLTEGLILSGIAMSFAQVSRPASGIEHYFSHIFDMNRLEKGTPSSLHGIQVGIGTILTLSIYDKIRTLTPDREKAINYVKQFDYSNWEKEMYRIFGMNAKSIIELEGIEGKNDRNTHPKRLDIILKNWNKLKAIMDEELPSSEYVEGILKDLDAPTRPMDIGISHDQVYDAFMGTKEIRDKYIASRLLWDLGLLDQYGDDLAKELAE